MQDKNRIHFIGVGGIGMSALARHFLSEKKQVSGSDRALSPITKKLAEEGIQIFGEQMAENITKDIDLVIYTEAVSPDSEGYKELQAAKKLKIPCVNYFEALGQAMNPYYLIAVAGTHGKTTTTAMTADIFEAAEKDPTVVVGSLRAKTQSNYRAGKSKYAIVEACEYKKDFLHLNPDILVITNIEFDHADYFKSLNEVQDAFREMIGRVNEGGVVVTDKHHPNIAPVLEGFAGKVIDYKEFLDMSIDLKVPGIHNRLNAAAAKAVAKQEKIDSEKIEEALRNFTGTWRRFEYKGDINGAPVYDDYAHHPTAIEAVIASARELQPDRSLTIVFEPHTYSRTTALFDEFAKSFAGADRVILLPVYAARSEAPQGMRTSRDLAVKSLEYNPNVRFIETYEQVIADLKESMSAADVLAIVGAGNVTKIASEIVK